MLGLGNGISPDRRPWDPKEISGLAIWLQNNVNVSVGEWSDSSGNDNNATQATEANQAALSGGGLDFEGGDENYYNLKTKIEIAADENFLISAVLNIESYDSINCVLSDGASEFFEFQTNKKIRFKCADGTTSVLTMASSTFGAASKMLVTLSRNDSGTGTLVVYKNGSALSGSWGNETNPSAIDFVNLGVRNDSDRFFDGLVLELVVYDLGTGTISATELTELHSYLKSVHGL